MLPLLVDVVGVGERGKRGETGEICDGGYLSIRATSLAPLSWVAIVIFGSSKCSIDPCCAFCCFFLHRKKKNNSPSNASTAIREAPTATPTTTPLDVE